MYRNLLFSSAALLLLAATACQGRAPVAQLTPNSELNGFVQSLEQALEAHAWEEIIARADSTNYRIQVVEHEMPEAQYVAELFGLHRVENNIRQGSSVTWSDLERIESVRLHELTREQDRHTLTGEVRLVGGETLEIRAWIVERNGQFRLTGALG